MPFERINVFAILETELANINDRTRCEFLEQQQGSNRIGGEGLLFIDRLHLPRDRVRNTTA